MEKEKMPVAVTIKINDFDNFSKNFNKPFDRIFIETMQETMLSICKTLPECILGYTQANEIILILSNYDCGIKKANDNISDMTAEQFIEIFKKNINDFIEEGGAYSLTQYTYNKTKTEPHLRAIENKVPFKATFINISIEEITDFICKTQKEAIKNNILTAARIYLSNEEIQNKNITQIKEMLLDVHNINLDKYPIYYKIGSCCIKSKKDWYVEDEMPILEDNKDYIENKINFYK